MKVDSVFSSIYTVNLKPNLNLHSFFEVETRLIDVSIPISGGLRVPNNSAWTTGNVSDYDLNHLISAVK